MEKEVLNRVRSPVNYSDPTDDLGRRIKHQQVSWSRSSLVELCSKGENLAAISRVSVWLEPCKWD